MAQRGPTSLSPTYTKARISYSVCDRGNKQQAWEGGGEAPLISGLAGLRGSLPCVKGDGRFWRKVLAHCYQVSNLTNYGLLQ